MRSKDDKKRFGEAGENGEGRGGYEDNTVERGLEKNSMAERR